ncbi:unnamed protein product [Larinioides sclopetarius]|uniref:Uncharacterized protein n=1 Tax=Larinioides sclopetarius TaxID=280406 RepID=A0AAV2BT04_9ARAC
MSMTVLYDQSGYIMFKLYGVKRFDSEAVFLMCKLIRLPSKISRILNTESRQFRKWSSPRSIECWDAKRDQSYIVGTVIPFSPEPAFYLVTFQPRTRVASLVYGLQRLTRLPSKSSRILNLGKSVSGVPHVLLNVIWTQSRIRATFSVSSCLLES